MLWIEEGLQRLLPIIIYSDYSHVLYSKSSPCPYPTICEGGVHQAPRVSHGRCNAHISFMKWWLQLLVKKRRLDGLFVGQQKLLLEGKLRATIRLENTTSHLLTILAETYTLSKNIYRSLCWTSPMWPALEKRLLLTTAWQNKVASASLVKSSLWHFRYHSWIVRLVESVSYAKTKLPQTHLQLTAAAREVAASRWLILSWGLRFLPVCEPRNHLNSFLYKPGCKQLPVKFKQR